MAYKNVHKRIKRLCVLELIKEAKGNFPRRAKKYELTNKGLFQIMILGNVFGVAFNLTSPDFKYSNNIIITTILYQFFEVESIYKFMTPFRGILLAEYLRNCCRAIQEKVEEFMILSSKYRDQHFSLELENLINTEAEKFIFKIIMNSEADYVKIIGTKKKSDPLHIMNLFPEKDNQDPNYNTLLPKAALANDKKFLKLLKKIKENFDKGCRDYSSSFQSLD